MLGNVDMNLLQMELMEIVKVSFVVARLREKRARRDRRVSLPLSQNKKGERGG
jgi:hypothetical protein